MYPGIAWRHPLPSAPRRSSDTGQGPRTQNTGRRASDVGRRTCVRLSMIASFFFIFFSFSGGRRGGFSRESMTPDSSSPCATKSSLRVGCSVPGVLRDDVCWIKPLPLSSASAKRGSQHMPRLVFSRLVPRCPNPAADLATPRDQLVHSKVSARLRKRAARRGATTQVRTFPWNKASRALLEGTRCKRRPAEAGPIRGCEQR